MPGVLDLLLEGFVRSQGRPRHLLGNHVVLDLGDGVFAVFAHVRRGDPRPGRDGGSRPTGPGEP